MARVHAGAVFGVGSVAEELFQALDARMAEAFPHAKVTVHKTQVSYHNGRTFAVAWIPYGKSKNARSKDIMISFSLRRQLADARIHDSIWRSANRCVHHVSVKSRDEIDDALLNWLAESDSIPRGR